MKTNWTVRVVQMADDHGHLSGLWLEQLRRMGYVRLLAASDTRDVLEFPAPDGVSSQVWAEQNAERMQSFGINAAAAPRWDGGLITEADLPKRA